MQIDVQTNGPEKENGIMKESEFEMNELDSEFSVLRMRFIPDLRYHGNVHRYIVAIADKTSLSTSCVRKL